MKKIIFIISSFFMMINLVDALTLTCPSIASPKETITCNIEDKEYIGLKVNYQFDNSFTYNHITNLSWKKYHDSTNGFSIGNISTTEPLSMNFEFLISPDTEVNKEYLVELTNIEAVDTNYQYIKLDNLTSKIKVVSNINTLENLEVKDHNLTPKFDSNTTSYKVTTTNESVVINATPTDENATVTKDIGEKSLQYGINNFTITVTSVKGESKNYYLYITREAKKIPKSSDFTLKSLTINSGKLDFDKNKYLYNVDVDYNTENIEVTATPTSDKATIKIEKPDKLVVGKNTISIIVTAEDGTTGKYIIEVNKKDKLSSDASIKNINIKGYTLDFKSNIYEYELKIDDESKLDIEVELNSKLAKYTISGNKKLKNNSTITIKVEAEDGTIQKYKIKITKQETTNSTSFFSKFKIIPLIIFITLILVIIIIKTIKNKYHKHSNDNNQEAK